MGCMLYVYSHNAHAISQSESEIYKSYFIIIILHYYLNNAFYLRYTYGQDVRGTVDLKVYFNRWSDQKIKKQLQVGSTSSSPGPTVF